MLLFSFFVILMITWTHLKPPYTHDIESSDWSGYVVISDSANPAPMVQNVSASWIVPTVTVSSTDTFSNVWIAIGGQLDDSLIQTGTSQDSVDDVMSTRHSTNFFWITLSRLSQ